MDIKITYQGTPVDSYQEAIQNATKQAIEQSILGKLAPYKAEIEKQGGKIRITTTGDMRYARSRVEVLNLSPDLEQKVMSALQ